MNPTLDNTRALGVGDCISPADFFVIPAVNGEALEMMPVDEPEVGRILDGSELHEYRRYTQRDPLDVICEENGIETAIARKALAHFIPCLKLLDAKQKAYGMGNVDWLGEYGVNLRVGEKATRIKWLLDQRYDPETETVKDSWMDNVNLSLIGLMCHLKQWK